MRIFLVPYKNTYIYPDLLKKKSRYSPVKVSKYEQDKVRPKLFEIVKI